MIRIDLHRGGLMSEENKENASFWYSMKAILWAMLGVRRGSGYDEDVAKIKPLQAIIVALLAVILFIVTLVFVVSLVT